MSHTTTSQPTQQLPTAYDALISMLRAIPTGDYPSMELCNYRLLDEDSVKTKADRWLRHLDRLADAKTRALVEIGAQVPKPWEELDRSLLFHALWELSDYLSEVRGFRQYQVVWMKKNIYLCEEGPEDVVSCIIEAVTDVIECNRLLRNIRACRFPLKRARVPARRPAKPSSSCDTSPSVQPTGSGGPAASPSRNPQISGISEASWKALHHGVFACEIPCAYRAPAEVIGKARTLLSVGAMLELVRVAGRANNAAVADSLRRELARLWLHACDTIRKATDVALLDVADSSQAATPELILETTGYAIEFVIKYRDFWNTVLAWVRDGALHGEAIGCLLNHVAEQEQCIQELEEWLQVVGDAAQHRARGEKLPASVLF